MFGFFKRLFGRSSAPVVAPAKVLSPAKGVPTQGPDIVLSSDEIYRYVTERKKADSEGFSSEIYDRGLAFGDLKVRGSFSRQVEFALPYDRVHDLSEDFVVDTLRSVMESKGIVGYDIIRDSSWGTIGVETEHIASEEFEGQVCSGYRNEQSFRTKIFLEIRYRGTAEFKAYGPRGVSVIMSFVEAIGLTTAPSMYLFESTVPLAEFVEHALLWHDAVHGKYFAELKYNPSEERHLVLNGGRYKEFLEDGKKTVILGGEETSGFKLNNEKVELTAIAEPTTAMLKARELIRKELLERNVCAVKGCGRKAVHQIYNIDMEMGGSMGGMTHGSVTLACDAAGHLERAKRIDPTMKQQVTPVSEEVW